MYPTGEFHKNTEITRWNNGKGKINKMRNLEIEKKNYSNNKRK